MSCTSRDLISTAFHNYSANPTRPNKPQVIHTQCFHQVVGGNPTGQPHSERLCFWACVLFVLIRVCTLHG